VSVVVLESTSSERIEIKEIGLWYRVYARGRVDRGGAISHVFARLGQRRFEGLDRELRIIFKDLIIPSGSTVLEVGDWVTIIGEPGVIQHLRETALASPRPPRA
jgi:hypothetical protein